MPLMNSNQFVTLVHEIHCARSVFAFEQAHKQLCVFTPDKNFYKLALLYNTSAQKWQCSQDSLMQFDLQHIQMLICLREGAKAVKEHTANGGSFFNPCFNYNTHFTELSSKIDDFENTANYEYYCSYFYKEIYTPLSHFHPKIQYHAPSCVLHSISNDTEANLRAC